MSLFTPLEVYYCPCGNEIDIFAFDVTVIVFMVDFGRNKRLVFIPEKPTDERKAMDLRVKPAQFSRNKLSKIYINL
jgi:hypothetical protein